MNNNAYVMSASFEAKKNTQATMITAGFAGLLLLLMFLWSWTVLPILPPPVEEGIMVELNIPDEPMPARGGGGGGGNPVQASGEKGTAYSPPQPGTKDDSKDIEEDETDKSTPAILKPDNPKPTATKINENKSVVKTPPKEIVAVPAPAKPKAVLGRTTTGTSTGGGVATDYDRAGGTGPGNGVGNGPGTGGGSGGGNGGGNGPGSGTGNGPRRVSGSRTVISAKPMSAGENIQGKILAEIKVSPEGKGTFVMSKGGSLMSNGQAIEIVKDWLRRNRFNSASDESTVVYEFNIKIGG
ncbi:MAG: hypothetical protein WDN26_00375 [Chitinophagaceae bacterium]